MVRHGHRCSTVYVDLSGARCGHDRPPVSTRMQRPCRQAMVTERDQVAVGPIRSGPHGKREIHESVVQDRVSHGSRWEALPSTLGWRVAR